MEAVAITKYVENFDGLLLRSRVRTENVFNFRLKEYIFKCVGERN